MASVTVTIPNSDWHASATSIQWNGSGSAINIALGTSLSVDGATELYLAYLRLPNAPGSSTDTQIQLSEGTGAGDELGPEFSTQMEQSGTITLEASDNSSLTITGISDASDPYQWTPANNNDVRAFGAILSALTDRSLTVTFNDNAAQDHAVDASPASWTFDVPEPEVTHTEAVATAPARPSGPSLVVDSSTQITATGVEPDDGGSPITSYDWRHRVRGSGGSGWVNRSNVTSLIQAFSGLDASTEYDFRFRATNDVGDSPYSFPVRETTDDAPPVSVDHAVDAGAASWTFAVPQPTVTHTTPAATTDHAVDASPATWSFDVPQPTIRHTTVGPQDHAVDASPAVWTFHVPEPRVTHIPPGPPVLTWQLRVDWDNAGDFSVAGADVTGRIVSAINCKRGRDFDGLGRRTTDAWTPLCDARQLKRRLQPLQGGEPPCGQPAPRGEGTAASALEGRLLRPLVGLPAEAARAVDSRRAARR